MAEDIEFDEGPMLSLKDGFKIEESTDPREIKRRFGKYVKNGCVFVCVHPQYAIMTHRGITKQLEYLKEEIRILREDGKHEKANKKTVHYITSQIETFLLAKLKEQEHLTFINLNSTLKCDEYRKYIRGAIGTGENFIGYYIYRNEDITNIPKEMEEVFSILDVKKVYLFGEVFGGCVDASYGGIQKFCEVTVIPQATLEYEDYVEIDKEELTVEAYIEFLRTREYHRQTIENLATDEKIKDLLGISLNEKWGELRAEL
ncbi:MAG: hypothetical protein QF475_00825 [Candidatus Undinarchaeales archaeon]|nr:hypothetical protein [Candidatus Undinarchaeales archaeon]